MAQRNKPERLAPAGDLERLRAALDYGADAVYLGRESFSMRAAASNFHSAEQLHEAVALAHQYGKKVYLTCNTLPRNEEIPTFPRFLQEAQDAGADALILADLGLPWIASRLAAFARFARSNLPAVAPFSASTRISRFFFVLSVTTSPRSSANLAACSASSHAAFS